MANLEASPRPTHKWGARVPDLNPFSWPPPFIYATNLTLGFLLTYKAPTPFGPYILCPEIESKSIFIKFTSIGIFPKPYAASVWKKILFYLQIYPISFNGWITPISLWTNIIEHIKVSSLIALFN